MSSGRFITVEGVEGVGKSTNVAFLADLIRAEGFEVLVTREPGGTPLGERVREILLDKSEQEMSPIAELLLMFAARVQHVEQVIKPALNRGTWVISDRFTDSSYAYQGGGRQLGEQKVREVEISSLGDFRPDLVLVLDLDVEEGLKRAARVGVADRFESEQKLFFERVRAVFLERATQAGYALIDASVSVDEVQTEIKRVVSAFLQVSFK
jgi:dTMP kinase